MQKICTILTKDKKQYKVELPLLRNYSNFFNVMIEEQNIQQLKLIELDHILSQAFDYIYQFLQLHKSTLPKQVTKPVLKHIHLSTVMSEQDAELMQRINQLSNQLKAQILNSAMYLQIQSFKKLLTYAILQRQLEQEVQIIKTNEDYQQEIKNQIQLRIHNLIQMENHKKRLEQENF